MAYTRPGESGYYIFEEGNHINFTLEIVSNNEIDVFFHKLYKTHNNDFWARVHHGGRIIENYEKKRIRLKRHDRFMDDTEAESAVISALAGEIWREHYTPIIGVQQVEYMLAKFQSPEQIYADIKESGYVYFTAKCEKHNEQDEPLGYCAVQPKGGHLFLSKIYVKTGQRGRGIARSFMSEAYALCRWEYGLDKIRLTVNKNNEKAIAVYQKWGFETVDSVKTDIGEGFFMDDYVMEKQMVWPERNEDEYDKKESSLDFLDRLNDKREG